MNPTGKKLISLFFVFSLMMLPTSLYAKKRGAKLIVIKKDGQRIKGELITVKPNSLLLLNTEGKDVSVDIVDIKVIKIVRKLIEKIGVIEIGSIIGFGIGAGIASVGYAKGDDLGYPNKLSAVIYYSVYGGLIGVIIGVIAITIIDKTIKIEGMTDLEIQETLNKLRKKARIRDYK